MAIYKDICHDIKKDDLAREVYRFEGARTRSSFAINEDISGDYIYFSKSLDHHKYFTVKRIRQMINRLLLDEYGIPLSNATLHDDYHKIKHLVLYNENIKDLHSYRLVCASPFEELIRDNYQYNHDKKSGNRGIERVDRRVYGGGYGVSDEWKKLMVYLTMFTASHKITRNDLLELIRNMKVTNRISRKNNIDFMFSGTNDIYSYDINELLFSDFNKYNIINTLEAILDNGLALPDSELSKHPTKTIKSVVNEYEKGRVKTLELLGKRKY
jgi:hypothetical protein